MASLVTIDSFRAHLRLEDDETSEDPLLQGMLDAAEAFVGLHLERSITTDDALTAADKLVIAQAVMVTACAWEADREGAGNLPPAAVTLLRPLRNLGR